jgi:serralysin
MLADAATFNLAKYFDGTWTKPDTFLSDGAKSVLGILDANLNEKYIARWNFPDVLFNPANKPFTAGIGKGVTLTYTFLGDKFPDYYAGYTSSAPGYNYDQFSAFSEEQKDSTRKVLAHIAQVANITFVEKTEANGIVGDITFANLPLDTSIGGYAYLPSYQYTTIANIVFNISKVGIGGDVWINGADVWNRYATNDWEEGGDGFATLLHEIGHALGLKHPHDVNFDQTVLSSSLDDESHTVMSYQMAENTLILGNSGYFHYLRPSTLMPFDIEALQYLYGANTKTRSGDTTYSWENTPEILQTIWDAGGVDAIDASNQTKDCVINLNAGEYSSIGLRNAAPDLYFGQNNLAIAKGVVIENAKGGSGNDTLIGNAVDNRLEGGLGNDTYAGYKLGASIGNDIIRDTGGNDRIEIANARADAGLENVEIRHTGGNLVLTLSAGNSITISDFYASGTTPGSGAIETLAGLDWSIGLAGVADDLAANSHISLGDIWFA